MDTKPTQAAPPQRPVIGDRRALLAACAGNVVEWYDYAIYSGSATVLAAVLAPGGWAGITTIFAVFATSCLLRPLGSLAAGARADRLGRRQTLAAMILMMAAATVAIGLLPPWTAIGVLAPLCLLALRAVQAFSVGGELGVSVAYLIEFSPARRRGRLGGWYLSTVAAGLAIGLGTTAAVAALVDTATLHSWAWRVPFLLALPLGLVGLYLRTRAAETPDFHHDRRRDVSTHSVPRGSSQALSGAPARPRVRPTVVLRENLSTIRRCFLLAAAYSATFNIWFVFVPSYVTTTGRSSLAVALACAMVGLVSTAIAAPIFGRLSDRIGRRPVLIGGCSVLVVAGIPVYLWAVNGSAAALLVGNVIVGVTVAAFVLPSYLAEQFTAAVRATGLGWAYGVAAAVIGGTAPLLATVLAQRAPAVAVPAYIAVWAAAALVAVLRSAETAPALEGISRRRRHGSAARAPRSRRNPRR
jgi:MHS family proline/betaine transporter-like MFS transporter